MTSKKRYEKLMTISHFGGELFASFLFSLLFLIFIYRFISPEYDISYAELSFYVGLGFLAAMFTPSFRYIVDVIPLITLIKLFESGFSWRRLLHIPFQLLGAYFAVQIFLMLNECCLSNIGEVYHFNTIRYSIESPWVTGFANGIIVAIIYYIYYIIRYVFREVEFSGTLFLSILIMLLFFASGWIANTSVINPFALFFYGLETGGAFPFTLQEFIIHVISPIFFLIVSRGYIRINLVREYIDTKIKNNKIGGFKNYDV